MTDKAFHRIMSLLFAIMAAMTLWGVVELARLGWRLLWELVG
jgi:hypothetical protein